MTPQFTPCHERKKNNVDKDNLNGPDNGLQINQNWIWKEMMKLRKAIVILTEHQGLETK